MITTKAKILINNHIGSDIYKMVLFVKDMPTVKAGQFLMIDCGKSEGITLKRPISIHSFDNDTLTIIYKVVGKGTKALSQIKSGNDIEVILPLGNSFDAKTYSNIALVGGGIGMFPLFAVITEYPNKNYYAYLGCKDKTGFVCEDVFLDSCVVTELTTEDGSVGQKGFVTNLLKRDLKKFDAIFACGPKPMLKALKELVKDTQIPTFVSMEERLGCGFGACLTCACKTNKGNLRVCADGPVFDIREVIL